MHKSSNVFKKALAILLCLSFLSAIITVEPVQAARAAGESVGDYLNRCQNSITSLATLNPMPKVIAYAYLVGEDDMAAASWLRDPVTFTAVTHEMYAVAPGTEIQGYIYSNYYPQGNIEYIKDIEANYEVALPGTGRINNMPEGAQYLEREGCRFLVVACDEEWVTIWDNGYQAWNAYYASDGVASTFGCVDTTLDSYLETHPAGFYKIQRNKVWLDFALPANHPYGSEAEIPKAGTGVVTKLVPLRAVPNEEEKMYTPVYALPTNTKVNVVSTELVPSEAAGSTNKYYKVSFNGSAEVQNNNVGYLSYQVPGVYYVDSRYLNVTPSGTQLPAGTALGEVTNVAGNEDVYVYQSRDTGSQQLGILSLGAEIDMLPSESDAEWTVVFWGGQKAYVQSKYIKKGTYKVKDISNLRMADIVKEKIKMSWDAGENNVEYSCRILAKGKVIWSNKHCKTNSFYIKNKYILKYPVLRVKVQATDKNGKKGKTLIQDIVTPMKGQKISKAEKMCMAIGRTKITHKFIKYTKMVSFGESLQYSTNKKFKKAVTVEKYNKKSKTYKPIKAIKKLKPNKTYYIRRRYKKQYSTDAGKKYLSGKWSKYIKIKTKK